MTTLKHFAPNTFNYTYQEGWGQFTHDGYAVLHVPTGKAYAVNFPTAVSGVRPATLSVEEPGAKTIEREILDQLPQGAAISPLGHSGCAWVAVKAEDFSEGFARLGDAVVVISR